MKVTLYTGPSIKYVTLFLANVYPLPLSHFVTHPGTPSKVRLTSRIPFRYLVGLVQKTRTRAPCRLQLILSQLFARDFVRGFCQRVFCLEDFVRGGFCPFPLLSEYICYNRKLNIMLKDKLLSYITTTLILRYTSSLTFTVA